LKPKVLQLIGNLHAAGSERQAAQLTFSLQADGRCEVLVACMDPRGMLREEFERAGLGDIPSFPLTSFYDSNTIVQINRFARFLRKKKIDVIQTHDFYTNVFGMISATLARVPVRVAARRETIGWRTARQKFIERRAYQLSHAIIANAEAVRQHLIEEGVREDKIVTIYNGLDLRRVMPKYQRYEAFKVFDLPNNGHCRYVTIVANLLHPVKDYPTFLRAARIVSEAVPEARFISAGDGELKEQMRGLAREIGLDQKVFFIGRCENIADLLSISSVCVLSSLAEGFSNSILEYMGAGRPVVVTNVGGASECVTEGKNGYLVRPGDYEKMAEQIIALLRNPECANAMGEAGREIVEREFSVRAQSDRTLDLYERLLRKTSFSLAKVSTSMFCGFF
jgi:glycosyltransferase involved in cell wall biosynthesis